MWREEPSLISTQRRLFRRWARLKNVSLCNRSCEPGNGGFQWFSCWRALSPPFVAFFSGISTVFELIVIAMVIADAKTDPEKKQFLDQDHVRALLAVPTKPTRVDPDRAIRLQLRAEEAKSAGDLEGAIRLFGRAIRHTPTTRRYFCFVEARSSRSIGLRMRQKTSLLALSPIPAIRP